MDSDTFTFQFTFLFFVHVNECLNNNGPANIKCDQSWSYANNIMV